MKQINLPMKRSFLEFMSLCEAAYDKDIAARGFQMSGSARPGGEGRLSPKRTKDTQGNIKSTAKQQKRMKAAGGGKMVPAKKYKLRKDAGKPNPRRSPAGREQQPTKERGSARETQLAAAKAERRKAAQARIAAKKGKVTVLPSQATSKPKTKSKDLERKASQMLTKKKKQTVDPNYKPQKASGYTRAERRAIKRQGDKLIGDIQKGINRPKSAYAVKLGGGKMMS